MTDTSECVKEINQFIESIKREMYLDNTSNDTKKSKMTLYLESSDIYDKTIITDYYKYARIYYNGNTKILSKCPIEFKKSINKYDVISELQENNEIKENFHPYKYINNEFTNIIPGLRGQWKYYSFNINLSFRDKIRFYKEDILNKLK